MLWFVKVVFVAAGSALDDFVEFTSVEPDSPAFRAIIDFDSLLVGDNKRYIANWTIHVYDVFNVSNGVFFFGKRRDKMTEIASIPMMVSSEMTIGIL